MCECVSFHGVFDVVCFVASCWLGSVSFVGLVFVCLVCLLL